MLGGPLGEAPAQAGASSLRAELAARIDRGRAERRVLRTGLILIGGFVVATLVSAVLGGTARVGWPTLHIALVGAATVGIGTFMPHFAVTLAGTTPEPAPARLLVLGLLAVGAAGVIGGVGYGIGWLVVAAGMLLLAGVLGTGWMTFAPMRRGITRRHPVVQLTYGAALLQVAVGASIAMLLYAGWPPVVSHWAELKVAHAWLTLFGFVSLTVVATLVYLFPTVTGARIRVHPSLMVLVVGCVAGPPLVALGAAVDAGPLVAAGAWLTVTGAIGQAWYVIDIWRRRGRWAFDHAWHRIVIAHLAAGPAWFLVAVVVVAFAIGLGTPVSGWSVGAATVPLLGGWVVQELIGSWSHLLPAVGPGDAAAHARQRDLLGLWPIPRLVALNLGVALAWAGLELRLPALTVAGAALLLAATALAVALLARSLRA
ncbi:MAG TPA: hypothetical protein VF013_03830 [Candidatus Limnocylindria bacterium]